MIERDQVLSRHGYHHLRVKAVVQETDDTRSFVLEVPDDLRDDFAYRPGQFCTFRVRPGDQGADESELARCYSMSSAPETDADLTVTVKRVPGGAVSNWFNDHVREGDVLEVTRPSGTFCPRDLARPVVGFCGGSGVTPVLSIAKSVLASSPRPVHLLYANRDHGSVIFDDVLRSLQTQHPDTLHLRHHLDADGGFLDRDAIAEFVESVGEHLDADFYICGPGPFMDLVEGTLLGLGVAPDAIFIERFVTTPPAAMDVGDLAAVPEHLVLILKGKRNEIAYRAGDTVLETARRANLAAPYSCEAGSCATCMALVREGSVTMRTNDALDDDEVAEGWVLTCQSVPNSATLTVEYEPL